jgi:hypothetical protein
MTKFQGVRRALALALLVLRILANHHNFALAFYYFAFIAHFFN